jgi:hypothetical protein
MSLTNELKDSESPVLKLFQTYLPNTKRAVTEAREALSRAKTVRPDENIPWSTTGTALDYRIRYYFDVTLSQDLVAWLGAKLCTGQSVAVATGVKSGRRYFRASFIQEFFRQLGQDLEKLNPPGRRLSDEDENLLLRYCYTLALFEEVFRAGTDIQSPLYCPSPKKSIKNILSIPPAHVIEDLRVLSVGFHKQFRRLLSSPVALNPVFDGSSEIGGADADLILDKCLIDIKTTVKARLDPKWLYQLIGYCLLDFGDHYRIREVGIYFARQQLFSKWTLRELLATLAEGKPPSMRKLRQQLQLVLADLY